MHVAGPSGRRVRLPWPASSAFPGHAHASRRSSFDDSIRSAALEAGVDDIHGAAARVALDGNSVRLSLADGRAVRGRFLVAADGSLSRLASVTGLVDDRRALLGFALRCYVEGRLERPTIVCWRPRAVRRFPGYGWAFPVPGGINVGLGVALGADRRGAERVRALLAEFVRAAAADGYIEVEEPVPRAVKGGWLRMGLAGVVPSRAWT